jgi:CRISPR-associated endonuclease Cas2
MYRLLISYDLQWPNASEDDYGELYKALAEIGARRIQESVWAVRSEKTPNELFKRLHRHLHAGDRLLVARISSFRSVEAIHLLKFV